MNTTLRSALLSGCLALASLAPVSDAGALVVGGFESAPLSGWYASPGTIAGVTTSYTQYGGELTWTATEGSSFAYIRPTYVSPVSGRFSLVSDVFTLSAASNLSFDLFLDPADEWGSPRRAMVHLVRADLTAGGDDEELVFTRGYSDASLLSDGWTHVSHRIAGAGQYRVAFSISGDETGLPWSRTAKSYMGFDDVRVDPDTQSPPIPEPGTLALLAAGLAGSGLMGGGLRLRRRNRT